MNMYTKPLLVAALLALPGFAAAQAAPASDTEAVDMTVTATPQVREDPNCLRYTGSVIVANQNQRNARAARASGSEAEQPVCNGSIGRSYTQDDIRRAGAVDTADALRRLDPSIR